MDLLKPSYATGYAKNASQSAHPNLWDGLVGAWMPSLGVTGGTVKDVSGNSNDVTLFDDAHFETTSRGHAIDFDRNGDYAVSAENTSFVIGTGAFTILQWVYVRSLAGVSYGMWDTLELGGSASRNNDFVMYWSGSQIGYNKVGVYSSGATRVQSDNALTLNEWHLIGLRRKNTGANGADVITNLTKNTSYTLATNITSTANVFGRISEGNVFHLDGQIASFQMWGRALSDAEIKQLYVDSLAPFRRKQRVSVAVPAAVAPSATYHPLRSLAHPLEQ